MRNFPETDEQVINTKKIVRWDEASAESSGLFFLYWSRVHLYLGNFCYIFRPKLINDQYQFQKVHLVRVIYWWEKYISLYWTMRNIIQNKLKFLNLPHLKNLFWIIIKVKLFPNKKFCFKNVDQPPNPKFWKNKNETSLDYA